MVRASFSYIWVLLRDRPINWSLDWFIDRDLFENKADTGWIILNLLSLVYFKMMNMCKFAQRCHLLAFLLLFFAPHIFFFFFFAARSAFLFLSPCLIKRPFNRAAVLSSNLTLTFPRNLRRRHIEIGTKERRCVNSMRTNNTHIYL